jgi:hypothetical protein
VQRTGGQVSAFVAWAVAWFAQGGVLGWAVNLELLLAGEPKALILHFDIKPNFCIKSSYFPRTDGSGLSNLFSNVCIDADVYV